MRSACFLLIAALINAVAHPAMADDAMKWPRGARVAVSLSYDDALDSQLDNAIPALNRHDIKASFYLTLASPPIRERLAEWRAAATDGHELGNHTIYHACRGSLPGREWVLPRNDLDTRSLAEMEAEVVMANTILHAIDGRDERTFTPPCADEVVGGQNYVDAVASLFVGIKTRDEGMPAGSSYLFMPSEISGIDLIRYVKEHTKSGVLLNILFHGVGGDHLSVSTEAHEDLLQFFADNSDTYWVDTYLNIMTHVRDR